MERWPNLFIVGPPKTGSTSLYAYLNLVPGIYMSPIKEPHYFSSGIKPIIKSHTPIQDKREYLKLFANVKNEKIMGEASTGYFSNPSTPKLIQADSPDAHIIISLRNPIERTYSGYFWHRSHGRLRSSFHNELQYELSEEMDPTKPNFHLENGLYSKGIERYLKIFGKKNVKILIFEEWVKDPINTVNEIIRFLGLNYKISNDFSLRTYNPHVVPRGPIPIGVFESDFVRNMANNLFSKSTRGFLRKFIVKKSTKPKMLKEDRKKLVEFFQEDVRKLENILGRKFPWPDFYN